MFGTVTMQVSSMIAWLMTIVVAIVLYVFIRKTEKSRSAKYAAEHADRQEERKERELKQKRDHQLNHGRQIYNWLKSELKKYESDGIQVWRIEDNGGSFAIQIIRKHEETIEGVSHILQLSYDFVRHPSPYLGHIHYGSYGIDILFWVGDHAPKAGIHELVIEKVEREVERRRSLKMAS